MIQVQIECPIKVYQILYNLPKDINLIIAIGGRGSGKTYNISQWAAEEATIKRKRIVVLRDEKSLIKESILNEIWQRYDTANETGILDQHFIKNDTELKDRETGKTLIYTKGFRASSLQQKTNLKGSSDIDIAIIEEGEDVRDKDKFYTFIDSLRKEGVIVVVILNVPDIQHFIIKQYFNCYQIEEGYFNIEPKQIPGFLCIKTTYKDNPFLPSHIVDRYKGYGDVNNSLYDKFYYMTAILGYSSTGRKGQILTKVKPIKLQDYLKLPFKEIYGQDFGTASPAGMVGVKFDSNNCYVRELNYMPMSILEIAKTYCRLDFNFSDKIICDSAEPDSIEKLQKGWCKAELSEDDFINYPKLTRGFNVIPCVKGVGSVNAGIALLNSMNIYAVEESTNLWNEIYNYVYDRDKNGNYTSDPIDEYNHCFVAKTLITTDNGNIKISKIKEGDKILTSEGFKKVLKTFNNGLKQTNKYLIQLDTFNISLQCTPDHKIKTTQGWIKISELQSGMMVYLNSHLMVKHINYIRVKSIFQEVVKECTSLFGNFMKGKYQIIIRFITKMKTLGITILKILKLKKNPNINQTMQKKDLITIQNGWKNFGKKELKRPNNGIIQKMVNNGIENNKKKIGIKENLRSIFVKNAVKNLNRNVFKNQNIVIKTVGLVHCEVAENKMVYDLMIEDCHEYYANGILVHNCIDPLRYVVQNGRPKNSTNKPMMGKNYHKSSY